MASTHKHIRSSTANKRPTTAIADGQIALNTNASSPGLFFKDSTGASIIKIGPVHVGSSAPNATPGAGGSSGNSTGEIWLDNSLTPVGVKIWNGSAWVNATPVGSTTVQGLLELATSAETQTGTDTDRAVTPAGLQSKLSDSTSTTSSITIASSTAVKSAYDLANAALPKSGGTITGNLEIGTTGSLSFEGSTADAFETTIAVTDPTADRTITLPDTTGTIVTTGDSGTVTGTMIASGTVTSSNIVDGTIVDADISASAAIAHSKLANITAASVLLGNASNVPTATALTGDVTVTSSGVTSISSGVIVNADVNASAAIAGTKISPDFGSQNTTTTGTSTAASFIPTSSTVPTNGVYLPATNSVAISTNGANRFQIDSSGNITVDTNTFYVDAANNRVGVGTTSPSALLTVGAAYGGTPNSESRTVIQSAGNSYLTIGAGSSSQAGLLFADTAANNAGGILYTHSSDSLEFVAAGNERARIDSSGRLGIGTSAPTQTLHVENTNLVNPSLTWGANATQTIRVSGIRELALGVTGAAPYDCYLQARTNASTAQALLLNPAGGNVGIGITVPSRKLVISNNGAECYEIGPGESSNLNQEVHFNRSTSVYVTKRVDAAQHIFNSATGEVARIDSSGRLLVGTSTARANFFNTTVSPQFQIEGTGDFDRQAAIISSSSTAIFGAVQILAHQKSGTLNGNTILANGDSIGLTSFQGNDGTQFVEAARIEANVDGTPGADDMPGRLVFSTTADGASSPTERMRINNTGTVTINGTTSVAGGTHTIQDSGSSPNTLRLYNNTDSNNTGNRFLICDAGASVLRAEIRSNGGLANYSANNANLSDRNAKKDIALAAGTWDCIKEWEIVNYRYKDQPDDADLNLGVIAQQVAESCPEVITVFEEAKDDQPEKLGVKEQQMYWMAIKALQEAQVRIEALEAEVSALKAA